MEEVRKKFTALRQQAQATLAESPVDLEGYSREELQLMVEELKIHQVELELQHRDLMQAQQELEESRDLYAELYDFAPAGYLTLDRDGVIVEANLTVADMLGLNRSQVVGRRLASFVARQDQDTYFLFKRKLTAHHAPASCEVRLVKSDGAHFYANLQGKPRRKGQSDGSRLWIAIGDVTETRQMAARLRQADDALGQRVAELTYMHGTLVEEAEEREQVQQKLQRRNQELTMLNSIMAAVSSSLELRDVVASLQKLLAGQLNVAGGAIFFCDQIKQEMTLQAHWGLPPAVASALAVFAIAGSPLAPAVRQKKSRVWPDFRELPFWLELGLGESRPEWQSHLVVPLLAKGDVEGALGLFSQAPAGFGNTQVTFFEILGQQVGIAIQNARLFEQVRKGQRRLRYLAQRVFTAQENERYRVSRELHDEAGQALTGLKITLEMIRADLDRRDGGVTQTEAKLIQQQLDAAVELCELTMGQIRTLAHDLRPAALENLGLDMTLRSFCRDFSQRTHLAIDYGYSGGNLPELSTAVDIALYRFLQEALTNVAKHAGCSQVRVEFHCDETTISLTVEDNGRGFDTMAALEVHNQTQGIGLSGMQERLESIGGRLIISSRPGSGTRLVAWIPR